MIFIPRKWLIAGGVGVLAIAAAIAVPLAVIQPAPSPLAGLNKTCTADDTNILMSYLNGLPAHSVANFHTWCLQVNGTIWLRGKVGLTIEGGRWKQATPIPGDTAIRNNPATAPYCGSTAYEDSLWSEPTTGTVVMLWFEGGCDITLRHMTIVGTNPGGDGGPLQTDSFIDFAGTQRALVNDLTETGPYGDFVDVSELHECGNCGTDFPGTDVTIENSHFSTAGRVGIGIINAARVTVKNNVLSGAPLTMFDVEVDCTTCIKPAGFQDDILIEDNSVIGHGENNPGYGYLLAAETSATVNRLRFTNNRMTNGGQMRILITPQFPINDLQIDHNFANAPDSASGSTEPAIKILRAGTIEVNNNTFPVSKGGAFYIRPPGGATVCENNNPAPMCPPVSPVTPPALAMLP